MSRVVAVVLAGLAAGGGVVLSGIASVPGILLAGVLSTAGGIAALIAFSELGFAGAGYAFTRTGDFEGVSPSWSVPDARGWLLVVGGTVAAAAVNRVVFALGALAGIDPVATVSPPDGLSPAGLLLVAPVFVLVVGPAEEYLFRGVIQGYLKQSFTANGAIAWAAVLFTLIHIPNLVAAPSAAPLSLPVWFAVGAMFGWLYERSGTLVVPSLVHGVYNVVVFTVLFMEWGIV
jgi:membrane protease YdiL (CAAX protease family)